MICHRHGIIKYALLGILASGFLRPAAAKDIPVARIEDDSGLRLSIQKRWLEDPCALVQKLPAFREQLPGGVSVEVSGSRRGDEFTVYLARERGGAYPGWIQGSWVYTRAFSSGEGRRIRIFPRSDQYTYIQFRPMDGEEDKCLMDVVLYEAYVIRGLTLGLPFKRLLTIPLNDLLASLGSRFPRRYFDIDTDAYRDVREFIKNVRLELGGLAYRDDGGMDSRGRFVYINNGDLQTGKPGLNCSGFVKWIVDGILYPKTKTFLEIEPLKKATSEGRSSLSENYLARDPFFGLDWTRNLAMEVYRVYRSPDLALVEEVEVRDEKFAAMQDRRGGPAVPRSYPGFLTGAGFDITGLRAIMYTLAVDEPGFIYLASISREMGKPPLRQHYHTAVLAPHFTENGEFWVTVFESAVETSEAETLTIDKFLGRHVPRKSLVNLVRIPVEGPFSHRE